MATGTLYTYPENFRAYKIQAAANYSGFKLSTDSSFVYGTTNKSEEFLSKFPLGKVPAFESADGVCLNESNAIALYVANEQLRGSDQKVQAQISQWMNFADEEILPAVCTWVFPCMGVMQFNKQNTEKAKAELKAVLAVLNKLLSTKTFLVGERVTLADLSVATTLLLAYQWVFEPAFRDEYTHVNRWFETVVNQPQVKKALPEFKMCEKMAQFNAKKYAEMSGASDKKAEKPKKEKQQQAPKKEAEKKPEKVDTAAAAEDEPPKEKKGKSPFLDFPAGDKFIFDDWKKVYSNEDTEKVALPWFWEHFDPENYSIWYGVYQYAADLSPMDFMNVNLIGGMMQRLDGLRKYGFGTGVYFNSPSKSITALYICRGHKQPFELSEDLNVDAPSYKWEKLDYSKEETKKKIADYWVLPDVIDGFEIYDCKVFK